MSAAFRLSELGAERRVLLWMCVLIFVNQLGFGGIVPAMPLYADSFGISASAIGFAVAIYGLARAVIAMPTGQLCDRLGRRPTLAIGGAISALGNLWCAETDSFVWFLVARFVAGAGAGLILTAGQVVLADISRPPYRARMMSIYQGVFLFAVGMGPLPGGWLAAEYGLTAPFYAYTGAAALAGVLAFVAVPETRDFRASGSPAPSVAPKVAFKVQVGQLMRDLGFVLAGLVSFVNAFTRTGALFAIVPLYGATQLGLSTTEVGFAIATASIAGLVVTYPAGAIADRYGRKMVIVPMLVVMAGSYALYASATTFAWFIFASIAWGIAAAASGSTPAAYAADRAPPGMNAAAMSTFRLLGDMGYVVGPVLMGVIVDLADAETAFIVSAATLLLVGASFARWAPETARRPI